MARKKTWMLFAGSKKIPLNEHHRFSKLLNSPGDLKQWKRHFWNKGIKTAIAECDGKFALFTETLQ